MGRRAEVGEVRHWDSAVAPSNPTGAVENVAPGEWRSAAEQPAPQGRGRRAGGAEAEYLQDLRRRIGQPTPTFVRGIPYVVEHSFEQDGTRFEEAWFELDGKRYEASRMNLGEVLVRANDGSEVPREARMLGTDALLREKNRRIRSAGFDPAEIRRARREGGPIPPELMGPRPPALSVDVTPVPAVPAVPVRATLDQAAIARAESAGVAQLGGSPPQLGSGALHGSNAPVFLQRALLADTDLLPVNGFGHTTPASAEAQFPDPRPPAAGSWPGQLIARTYAVPDAGMPDGVGTVVAVFGGDGTILQAPDLGLRSGDPVLTNAAIQALNTDAGPPTNFTGMRYYAGRTPDPLRTGYLLGETPSERGVREERETVAYMAHQGAEMAEEAARVALKGAVSAADPANDEILQEWHGRRNTEEAELRTYQGPIEYPQKSIQILEGETDGLTASGEHVDRYAATPEERERYVLRRASDLLGVPAGSVTLGQLAALTGYEDAEIRILAHEHGVSVMAVLRDEQGTVVADCTRKLRLDDYGKPYLYNSSQDVVARGSGGRGQGLGTANLARQVRAAGNMGLSYIETCAGGSPGSSMNGYYTWPLLGFDAPLSSVPSGDLHAQRTGQTSLNGIMRTAEGRAYWKANGYQVDQAVFDLTPGSKSMQTLDAYVVETRNAKAVATLQSVGPGEHYSVPGVVSRMANPWGASRSMERLREARTARNASSEPLHLQRWGESDLPHIGPARAAHAAMLAAKTAPQLASYHRQPIERRAEIVRSYPRPPSPPELSGGRPINRAAAVGEQAPQRAFGGPAEERGTPLNQAAIDRFAERHPSPQTAMGLAAARTAQLTAAAANTARASATDPQRAYETARDALAAARTPDEVGYARSTLDAVLARHGGELARARELREAGGVGSGSPERLEALRAWRDRNPGEAYLDDEQEASRARANARDAVAGVDRFSARGVDDPWARTPEGQQRDAAAAERRRADIAAANQRAAQQWAASANIPTTSVWEADHEQERLRAEQRVAAQQFETASRHETDRAATSSTSSWSDLERAAQTDPMLSLKEPERLFRVLGQAPSPTSPDYALWERHRRAAQSKFRLEPQTGIWQGTGRTRRWATTARSVERDYPHASSTYAARQAAMQSRLTAEREGGEYDPATEARQIERWVADKRLIDQKWPETPLATRRQILHQRMRR